MMLARDDSGCQEEPLTLRCVVGAGPLRDAATAGDGGALPRTRAGILNHHDTPAIDLRRVATSVANLWSAELSPSGLKLASMLESAEIPYRCA